MSDSDSEDESVREEEYEKLKTRELVLRTEKTSAGGVLYGCAYCNSQPKPIEQLLIHARSSKKKKRYEHEGLAKYLDEVVCGIPKPKAQDGAPLSPPLCGPLLDKKTTEGVNTVWPPVVILANMPNNAEGTLIGNGPLKGLVNQCARDFDFHSIDKQVMYYDSHGRPTGEAFVKFQPTYAGYIEAEDFSKFLQRNECGREARWRSGKKCGWLATVEDMRRMDFNHKRVKWTTKPLSEVRDMHMTEMRKAEEMKQERDKWQDNAKQIALVALEAEDENRKLRLRHESMQVDLEEHRQTSRRIAEETERRLGKEREEERAAYEKRVSRLQHAKEHLLGENERLQQRKEADGSRLIQLKRQNEKAVADLRELRKQKDAIRRSGMELDDMRLKEKKALDERYAKEMEKIDELYRSTEKKLNEQSRWSIDSSETFEGLPDEFACALIPSSS
ncbi:XH domain-containing protein [Cymbomonas tetramitiformis]|uniref:XH domain-containing protein n=1 Tax=Cymbomonas tetramitiformis TaxID=36881 RepID=A0AAE0CHV5_9CHLO|nr:XH domain-containing protein [Cymbomonas tetramitiformis]